MKKWRHIISIAAIAVSTLVLAACGKSSSASSTNNDGKTVVSMYMPGDKPKNYDEMIKTANKEIQKKYPKLALNMNFIGWGDYDKKYNVMVTSGDTYDIAFTRDYVTNAQKGAYADLTDLIQTDAKTAYDQTDPAYWKGVTVKDKIYAFPVNANIYAQNMLTFSDDFVNKYNLDIDGVNSYQDLEPILTKFHKANPSVAAFAIGQGYKVSSKAMEYPLGNGLPFAVDATGKNKKIVNIYNTAEMQKNLKTLHQYYLKGYIPQDAATSSVQYRLQDASWLVRQETQGSFDYGDTTLINAAGGKQMTSKPITAPLKSQAQSQIALWSVSKSSKHKKEAVQILGLLNSNKKLLNNIVWGLQNKQWQFTDEKNGKIKTTADYKPGYFIGAWMMGNNKLLYTQDTVTQAMIDKRDQEIKTAKQSVMLGFMPDTSAYKTELTNLSNVMSKYSDILNTGTADPVPTIKQMNQELKKAGYDKVQAALQKQYDDFLKA
ncbi:ABC transporter substrate-binding protein [Lacticaseibacillus saniviri]|uniref:Sugar abc transporter, substrate binding protein n=1 Tax=Lacticaseibacillus saniviri JCM 17471 = DSM 24301 TaxID=1293598 RepID=A0A0R2MPL3_9LACO|nr:ABC transporter substrate-binding protein [Lacticaseibacillus saniviri]KRO15577.1 sugar abc transporter, substrate binding protein [Lacticaseibacillus saniviri JCM 17471 = DSM 24301]MCG4280966.1 ABC transporter substrate-binding protein [Lacticaseibacillus saniviri]